MNAPLEELTNPIIVCVEKPTIDGLQIGSFATLKWNNLETALASKTHLTENSKRLADNFWLFPEKGSAVHQRDFLSMCQGFGLSCHTYKIHGTLEALD